MRHRSWSSGPVQTRSCSSRGPATGCSRRTNLLNYRCRRLHLHPMSTKPQLNTRLVDNVQPGNCSTNVVVIWCIQYSNVIK